MAISNVSLTNTFDQWRVVTNQMVAVINDIEFTSNLVRTQSNTTPLVITSSVGRGGTLYFDVSTNSSYTNTSTDVLATSNAVNKLYIYLDASVNAVNNYANTLGISGNTYANNVGTAGNAYAVVVGISGNTYANAVGAAANAYAAALTPDLGAANNWANTVGISGNTYANAVGIAGNTWANTVGTSSNTWANSVGISGNTYANAIGAASNNWANSISATVTVSLEETLDSTYYPLFTSTVNGTITSANVSNTKLYFNPSSGTLSATTFNSLSDLTLKTDIQGFDGDFILDSINPVKFKWKNTTKHSFGVIAQELEKVLPDLVETNDDGIKSVSYIPLIAVLINSNKKLHARLEAVEKEVQELKKKS